MTSERLGSDIALVDVEHLDHPRGIAAGVLEGPRGVAIVDPGPASSLDGLRRGLLDLGHGVSDLRAILLTHIHLDHAGATGTLCRENPDIAVYVHERGAPHVIDPSRLLASAQRIYGDQLVPLFGDVVPVPEARVTTLAGGETLDVLGRTLEVVYTPGHAWHHVSFHDPASSTCFIGDTGGMRIDGLPLILPVAPPPDIDLERWKESIAAIRDRGPDRLFLTHFGVAPDPAAHLDTLEDRLEDWAEAVRGSLEEERPDEERARDFASEVRARMPPDLPPSDAEHYRRAGGIEESWYGLARYWRKRGAGE